MSKYLSDFQFGVGVSRGAEAVLHSANRLLSEYRNDGSLHCSLWTSRMHLTLWIDRHYKLRVGLFPFDIRRPSLGVKLLGGAVSRDTDFISGMAMRRAMNAVDLMNLLPQLHDPQSELLLLRSCMGISKLFFSLRTYQPVHMEEAALFFGKGLRGLIENIVGCTQKKRLLSMFLRPRGPKLGCYKTTSYVTMAYVVWMAIMFFALACLHDTSPSFDFRCFTNKDTSTSKAQQTLASALFSEIVKDGSPL
ncbi:hypothetical protein Tco_1415569 [Tanacetum coccineum]